MSKHRLLRTIPAFVAAASIATPALTAQTCFTAFGGSVHYQFAAPVTAFTARGTRDIPGVLFGALSPCAGLSFWGVVGTATNDGTTTVLGLRDETADATGCGAVDVTISLSPSTLSGPLQLYNERTNFGNTSTLQRARCETPPATATLRNGRDALGNTR